MSDQFGPKRPLGVTIVAALAIIAAVFDIIGGIVLLGMQGDADGGGGLRRHRGCWSPSGSCPSCSARSC